jgi:hypothetical protein
LIFHINLSVSNILATAMELRFLIDWMVVLNGRPRARLLSALCLRANQEKLRP